MKILFLAPQPFFRIRGTPINVRNMVTALSEAGHEVDLLCYPFGENLDIPGVTIHRSSGCPGIWDAKIGPSFAKLPLDMLMFMRAIWMCMRRRYDVIHAVEESAFFAMFLSRMFKIRFIYDMDSIISDQLFYSGFIRFRPLLRMVEWLELAAIRRAEFILTVCTSLTDMVNQKAPGARIVQIEDAPIQATFLEDHEGAQRLREKYGLELCQCVVYTGNFESYQGLDVLLKAAGHVIKKEKRTRFVLVGGEPPQVSRMKKLAQRLDIADYCVFTSKRPLEETPAYMTLSDVLVSPRTKGTNTALKLYTYMQSGRPVVATRLATHTQVLDDDCAILVLPQPDDLASGILRALRETLWASALGKEAKARVARKYSLASFKHKVRVAYQSLNPDNPV